MKMNWPGRTAWELLRRLDFPQCGDNDFLREDKRTELQCLLFDLIFKLMKLKQN